MSGRFSTNEEPGKHWIWSWWAQEPERKLSVRWKSLLITELKIWFPCRPALTQSLYRLSNSNIYEIKRKGKLKRVLYSLYWVIAQRLNSDGRQSPKIKNATFTTRRKFEIKNWKTLLPKTRSKKLDGAGSFGTSVHCTWHNATSQDTVLFEFGRNQEN